MCGGKTVCVPHTASIKVFLCFKDLILFLMCVCMCLTHACIHVNAGAQRIQKRASNNPGAGVTGTREPPGVGAEN